MVFTYLVSLTHKFLRPCGKKALIAENLLLKQQLFLLTRSRKRAPNLSPLDRFLLGLWTIFLHPRRIKRAAILIQPSTLLRYHHALVKWKYYLLFSAQKRRKPGPKGPSRQLIELVLEMKRRNPRFGCIKIAEQISKTFAIPVEKDVVRRILATHYQPDQTDGPSWLTFLGHTKDSLWSMDSSGVNPSDSKLIGSSSSWTNAHVGSSGSGSTRLLPWMGERCAVCSIRSPAEQGYPTGLAPIMIPSFGFTSGKRI